MRNFVTVVTGAPRSGTSMMMRMLDVGGIRAFTDGYRTPDIHNPNGYLEYGPVKRLTQDSSWLVVARGKAIKIVYPFLRFLPEQPAFRVVFMERDLADIVASQREMAVPRRDGAPEPPASSAIVTIAKELDNARAWLASRPNVQVFPARYEAILEAPEKWCADLLEFLGGDLNLPAMAAAVDPSLRHQHAGAPL